MIAARAVPFTCEKRPAIGSRGMVVANHPLASAAGAEMLLAGGNAVDGAVAALFALSVVEPMMVGVLGGGVIHLRLADGRNLILDNLSTAPAAASPTLYEALSEEVGRARDTRGRENLVGPRAVAVPGALAGWCEALARFGTASLFDVVAPAIRLSARGFIATPYLADAVSDCAADLARDPGLAALLLPGGAPIRAGDRLVQKDYAETLDLVAREGAAALHAGSLGRALTDLMATSGGLITSADLATYRVIERDPIRGGYRGYEIFGPPPPASAGVHIVQMLNILEGYDLARHGLRLRRDRPRFGGGSEDRVRGPCGRNRRPGLRPRAGRAPDLQGLRGRAPRRHRPAARAPLGSGSWRRIGEYHPPDSGGFLGNVVAATQTLNGSFGACVQVPGTGMIANNYMYNFDPHPGARSRSNRAKRVFTSMAPMMAVRDGRLAFALGLPGGAAHLSLGAAGDREPDRPRHDAAGGGRGAPHLDRGGVLEVEDAFPDAVISSLRDRGHDVVRVARIAGGMNAVSLDPDGTLTGAACWRADGTPVAVAGGLARAGVRFFHLSEDIHDRNRRRSRLPHARARRAVSRAAPARARAHPRHRAWRRASEGDHRGRRIRCRGPGRRVGRRAARRAKTETPAQDWRGGRQPGHRRRPRTRHFGRTHDGQQRGAGG
jgi:gamma-glutamyltranspeptidase/glutathione hydrolase